MPHLILYYAPNCPFCAKVTSFMEKNNITIKMVDRDWSKENHRELINLGGKPQVPCLSIDGKPLYESDDIIEWLKKNYGSR
ncbi:MAG: glutathione S-transferase N-terminal domain-containing protein [Desulfamplus sp.]|nr:glutathione S-transferase N-terminal domain-containing protein [Desulfamplus sp.]